MTDVKYEFIKSKWAEQTISSPEDVDRLLNNFRILFAYNSGKIENPEITYHDTREIFENGKVCGFTGNPRTLFEQQNQKTCYEVLKKHIAEKTPISIELIKEIHLLLTSGTLDEGRFIKNGERSGEFKKHDYITGKYEVGAAPEDVPDELNSLIDEINSAKSPNKLMIAAYLHARFEYIHPFADGNGRVGRTLMNYYLMINGNPPVVIFDEDRNEYYNSLEKYDAEEELKPLNKFLVYQTEKTWENTFLREEQPRKALNDILTDTENDNEI